MNLIKRKKKIKIDKLKDNQMNIHDFMKQHIDKIKL